MIKLKKVSYIFIILGFLQLFCPKCFVLLAQNPSQGSSDTTTVVENDSIVADSSLVRQDTVVTDTANIPGDIKTTIFYKSTDSAVFFMETNVLLLYKDAEIKYSSMTIKGAEIEGDMKTNEVTARYKTDTAGAKLGIPVFNDKGQEYQADNMRYNFKTRKGIIHGLVTKQGEGYVHGENVYKDSLENLYNHRAKYTTCDLPEPHFHIGASRIKMIPNKKVLAGPFNLYINDIWTPLGFVFGMFPMPKEKSSGIIVPSYGEARDRGFYLSGGGYYLALSDYFDLALTGDIYSLGGWGFSAQSTYLKKYRYNGNVSFRYFRRTIVQEQAKPFMATDFNFSWSHAPVPRGLSRFSANMNLSSSRYNARNAMSPMQRAQSNSSSSVNFSTGIRGTQATFSTSMRFTQNFQSGRTDVNFPQVAFSSGSIIPFESKTGNNKGIFRQIRTSYSMTGDNTLSNAVPEKGVDGRDTTVIYPFFETNNWSNFFKYGTAAVNHSVPLSTNFKVLKNITVTPGLSYSEVWRFKEFAPIIDSVTLLSKGLDTIQGFSRNYRYGANVGASTTFYGILNFKKGGLVEAVRHQVNPSLSLGYTPNLANIKNGQYGTREFDGQTIKYDRYTGAIVNNKTSTESARLTFSVNNILEAKVRSRKDSASNVKKIRIFDNLSLNTGYDFLADSFNLSDLTFSARTTLLSKLNINFGGTLNPYVFEKVSDEPNDRGRMVNRFAWNEGQGFGKITRINLGFTTNLNPDFFAGKKKKIEERKPATAEEEEELRMMKANPDAYVDWDVPWDLNINYTVSYSKNGLSKAVINNNLMLNGNVSLTQKWKVTFNTSYVFDQKKFSDITSFGIVRDLHCWELMVNWSPFGIRAYYNIEIHVRSSILKDLKLTRKRNVFGGM